MIRRQLQRIAKVFDGLPEGIFVLARFAHRSCVPSARSWMFSWNSKSKLMLSFSFVQFRKYVNLDLPVSSCCLPEYSWRGRRFLHFLACEQSVHLPHASTRSSGRPVAQERYPSGIPLVEQLITAVSESLNIEDPTRNHLLAQVGSQQSIKTVVCN